MNKDKTITINVDHYKTYFKYQIRKKDNTPVANVRVKNGEIFYETDLEKSEFLPSFMMYSIAQKVATDDYIVVVTDAKKLK